MRSIAAYVRRHHIGLLALFVALSGTAYAVQVAPKNSVVSKSIRDGQVRPADVRLTKTYEYPAAVEVFDDSEAQEPFNVTVPNSGLVSIYAEGEIRKIDGQANFPCSISYSTTGSTPYSPILSVDTEFNGFSLRRTAPSSGGEGVSTQRDAAPVTLSLEPGRYEFRIAYNTFTNTRCQFRNTRVVIIPLP